MGRLVDVILAVGKLLGRFASQSQALIADGIHSISDLVLYYVGASITGELTFPLPASELRGVLEESQALSEQLKTETPLSAVRIHYRA